MTPEAAAGAAGGLTIGQLAERTGVSQSTLRIWETRHGFPSPRRLPSGHRRYAETDAEAIGQVVRDRARGVSLGAAVEGVLAARERSSSSIFAGIRHRSPGLEPRLYDKRSLIRIARAVEDECLAQGERTILIGSFQEERFYRQAEERWRALAAGARTAVVFADFPEVRDRGTGPIELPIERTEPLAREWAVVCRGRAVTVALSAWQRPAEREGAGDGRFETIWSVRPELVDDAIHVAADLAARSSPAVGERIHEEAERGSPHAGGLDGVVSLTNRMLAYVTSPAV